MNLTRRTRRIKLSQLKILEYQCKMNSNRKVMNSKRKVRTSKRKGMKSIRKYDFTFDDLFMVDRGQHPPFLKILLSKKINYQTFVVFEENLDFIKRWDKEIKERRELARCPFCRVNIFSLPKTVYYS